MLTEEGYRERKWGRFPALRQALEDKALRQDYFGWTSVSNNIFEALPQTFETGILARDNTESLRETAHRTGWNAMHRDLELLDAELEAAGALLQRLAGEVRALHRLEHESPR